MDYLVRLFILIAIGYLILVCGFALFQRRLLYYPSHDPGTSGLSEWRNGGRLIGYAREVPSPRNVWLFLHGNGGQASDRAYALSSFSRLDAVFIVEYPGYGARPGAPSQTAIDEAAREGYRLLRSRFVGTPVCVVGESIGTGPASMLAMESQPPDKIVLVCPFDILSRVAAHHLPYLPARLMLRDNWNNVRSLEQYKGPLEIFGAREDSIIPIQFARALADSKPGCKFHEIEEGHNDWATEGRVTIRNP